MNQKKEESFRESIQKQLSFEGEKHKEFMLYHNKKRPELGETRDYQREGYYSLGIADYVIPNDFSLPFSQNRTIMRFGVFHIGKTQYQLKGGPVSFTTPSSYFVIESEIEGVQRWQKGQHYQGVGITIFKKYFEEVVIPLYPDADIMHCFEKNHTYHYLPEKIIRIIEEMVALSEKEALTGIYLESKILECIAILTNTLRSSKDNAFAFQTDYGNVSIGQNRNIKLIPSDIRAIQQVHKILQEEFCNPPSIGELSRRVFLNEQKLKAGFSYYYHMSIGAFVNSVRMTKASNLLATTDLNIEDIAKQVGYEYSGNFSRMFKKIYAKTPLEFRKTKAN